MSDPATDVFTALAHPTRRQILQDLKDGELAAGEIASRFTSSGPTISRHLGILRQAGRVTERRDANRILYALVGDRLALSVGDQMGNLLTPFWVAVGAGVARIDFRRFIGYLFVYAAIWFVLGVLIFTLIPV